MQLIHLEAAVVLGVVLLQIPSISISSPASGCLASVETCMSDLCSCERAFVTGNCEGIQQRRNTRTDWKSSNLADIVYDGSESCVDRIGLCVSESVCNRHLIPVLQACMADHCESERCQREIQQFYGGMPQQSAEMLVMCECDSSDQSCLLMKSSLQSGACGVETRICQERLTQCVQDSNCRYLLKTLQVKCWNHEETLCSERNLQENECFTLKDPALILGANSECKKAFLATLGTVLHHPCTCKGVHRDHLQMCNMILEVFHNRLHFIRLMESTGGPSKPPEVNKSEQVHMRSYGYLLYVFSAFFLAGVVILSPLLFLSKIWLKRRNQTKLNNGKKANHAVL
ncbi:hypothetical protein CRENBAI_007636 [Crenichthys baileyi]|uniref:GDNF/GAS1 domain-containing protein n=1 Tax=Crenichthys baileyi TaxID=28760 RepID=A0AAV9SIV7_9TELE